MKNRSQLAAIGISLLIQFVSDSVSAADQCSDILKSDLLNRTGRGSSSNLTLAQNNWACSASLNDVRNFTSEVQNRAGGGGGSFKLFGLFSVGGEGQGSTGSTVNEQQFELWKRDNCSNATSDQNRSAFEYFAQQSLDPKVIEAWKACKLGQPALSCWLSPQGTAQTVFHYSWRSYMAELPTIIEFTINTDGSEPPLTILEPGTRVYIGEATQVVPRNPNKPVLINFNIRQADRFSYACSSFLPASAVPPGGIRIPLPPPPSGRESKLSEVLGIWCDEAGNIFEWKAKAGGVVTRSLLRGSSNSEPDGVFLGNDTGFYLKTGPGFVGEDWNFFLGNKAMFRLADYKMIKRTKCALPSPPR
jgi:hypothetical protein